jgi:hypothetical protein
MWDIAEGGMTMLRVFWSAVRTIAPDVEGERPLAGTARGDIEARFARAGLVDVVGGALSARADDANFDDFWEPFKFAVGPSGQFLRSLPLQQQGRVREACQRELSDRPFSLDARAWYARGTVSAAATAQR